MIQTILTGCLIKEILKERRERRVRKVNTCLIDCILEGYLPGANREAQNLSERSRCHVQINKNKQRYALAFRGQGKLAGFGFKAPAYSPRVHGTNTEGKRTSSPIIAAELEQPIAQPPSQAEPLLPTSSLSQSSRARSASVLSDPSTDNDEETGRPESRLGDVAKNEEETSGSRLSDSEGAAEPEVDQGDIEGCEDKLEEGVQGATSHVCDWTDLRKQIKDHLKANSKTLPLSRVNQLLIISNFATLRIKGSSRTQASFEIAKQWHEGQGNWFARRVRALARHYQIFVKLPTEKRGGAGNSRSWLHDEQVQAQARNWLTLQKTGDVTPHKLCCALNDTIFPEMNIALKNPISERTARHWLIKLGWRRTVVRKGVYMDGHKHEDVVEYQDKVFLPAITRFESQMAKHEGPELIEELPELQEGEQRIIIQYHDESCFHANDEARNLWLREGEQPL